MKRTRDIRKTRFRKRTQFYQASILFAGVVAAGLFLTGCDDNAGVDRPYASVQECSSANPGMEKQCQDAYKKVVDEAKVNGREYQSKEDCERDFSDTQCQYTPHGSSAHWFPYPVYYSYNPVGSHGSAFYPSSSGSHSSFVTRSGSHFTPASNGLSAHSSTTARGGFGSSAHAISAHSAGG